MTMIVLIYDSDDDGIHTMGGYIFGHDLFT